MTLNALKNETVVASELRKNLADILADDEELTADTIEGETNLVELIDKAVAMIKTDNALIEGIKVFEGDIATRKKRISDRVEMLKAALQSAMETACIKSRECPAGTITLKELPGKTIITDESVVPSEYWQAQDPKLDKKAILNALKDDLDVPGATLSNGGNTIQIRTK